MHRCVVYKKCKTCSEYYLFKRRDKKKYRIYPGQGLFIACYKSNRKQTPNSIIISCYSTAVKGHRHNGSTSFD